MTTIDLRRLKVLLIDDESFIRSTIRQILVQIGMAQANVYEAATGASGLSETLRVRPNLVLCDIHMEYDDGFSYVANLRKCPISAVAAIPVIMLTSDSTETAVVSARELKVSGYLLKPVSLSAVKKTVERVLNIGG